jgi:methionine aminopeptidase
MGAGDDRIRFIGHGVGLEVDEFPFLAEGQKTRLQEGMTIALEPKMIFPGKGVVGIENTRGHDGRTASAYLCERADRYRLNPPTQKSEAPTQKGSRIRSAPFS